MDFIEGQAANQWSVGANNTWSQASPFLTTPTTARAFATLYKNNTTRPILIVATFDCAGTNSAVNVGDAMAAIELVDSGGTLIKEVCRVRVSEPTVSAAVVTGSCPVFCVVNPGEQYRLVDLDSPSGVTSIFSCFEFAFDARYTAQNWTHLESIAAAKLNTYAAGVNRIPPKDEAIAYSASSAMAAGDDLVAGDRVTLWLIEQAFAYSNIVTATGAAKTFTLKNSGGSALTVAKVGAILSGAAEVGGGKSMVAVISNAGGTVDSTSAGTGGAATKRNIEFVAPSYSDVTFTNGESGIPTGDKFRALDLRASKGIDMTAGLTRTSPTIAHPTTTIASISTGWRIAIFSGTLLSDATNNSVITVNIAGSPLYNVQDNSVSLVHYTLSGLFIIPPGSAATIVESGATQAITHLTVWDVT